MSINFKEFHNQVYHYLNDLRVTQPDLKYTYRKSNYGGRLEEGYWFYGNENYFSISFWSGMDWKNRTPNIAFFFLENGEARLEINVSDSDKKRDFVEKRLVNALGLDSYGRRYVKYYGIDKHNGIGFLRDFIVSIDEGISDKEKIDKIIEEEGNSYFNNVDDNFIGLIDPNEFRTWESKIEKYIELQDQEKKELHDATSKPAKISSIYIKGYQDIKEAFVENISSKTQWIFLTGENGSGKTTILKAIATSLGYKNLNKKEMKESPHFEVKIKLHKGREFYTYERVNNEGCNKRYPVVSALAVFGPNRLISHKDKSRTNKITKALKKEGTYNSLWDYEYKMLDIEEQFDIWKKDKKRGNDELEKRIYFIRTLLSRVVPGLYDIRFEKIKKNNSSKNVLETKYIIRKDESATEEEKYWQQLPSGTRSVFAMVSELLIRLYHFQKEILDPSELRGIVIIDEIDLHLHPNAQRQLIIDLTETFINIQFIVATHSPIPLLGAPSNSVFVKITRDPNNGILMERLLDIEKNIGNLLPNIIYTSSVFNMQNIISIVNDSKQDIITQDSNSEAIEYQRLKEKFQVKKINDIDYLNKLKEKLNG